jgi:hypothetical protein
MATGRFTKIIVGDGLVGTDNGDHTVTIDATAGGGSSPAADTVVWMPLTTVVSSVPELVWDATNSLIPTLTPI